MRIIKVRYKTLSINLSFSYDLWKLRWFSYKRNNMLFKFYLNILFLGVWFRIILFRKHYKLKKIKIK